jgi:PDZ domain
MTLKRNPAVLALIAALLLGGSLNVLASDRPALTATAPAPTAEPTAEPTLAATMAATEATQAATDVVATDVAASLLPPCPDPNAANISAATAEATGAATNEATQDSAFVPGYLGIEGQDFDLCGTQVTRIITDSPAQQGGLLIDDVIVGVLVGGDAAVPYKSVLALRSYIVTEPVGAQITLIVRRNGEEMTLTVTLGQRPAIAPTEVITAPTAEPTAEPSITATPT